MNKHASLCMIYLILLSPLMASKAVAQKNNPDRILGKWISEKKNLIVEIYRHEREYKAKILWFSDLDDLDRPACVRTDNQNPDPALRNRKILGMDVLKLLSYNKNTNSWENGVIYDALSGKEWSSYVYMNENGTLRVKGYWHFKFINKSMDFSPVTP